jgi:hypothetical protein
MKADTQKGQFQVIDSFVIRKRKQYYLIGEVKEGEVREYWNVYIPFNSTFGMSTTIAAIEEVEISTERNKKYMLLIVEAADNDELDLLLTLNIHLEVLDVSAPHAD